jgi:multidrug efflux system membrane fusion protein
MNESDPTLPHSKQHHADPVSHQSHHGERAPKAHPGNPSHQPHQGEHARQHHPGASAGPKGHSGDSSKARQSEAGAHQTQRGLHESHRQGEHGSKQQHGKKRHTWLLIVSLVCVVLAAWLLIHFFAKPAPKRAAPAGIPVSAGVAKLGAINVYLDALGTVTPVYTVTLTSRVAGELTEVFYKEGQMVKKGDLLAVIDPRPYQAMLLQAQGQLARDQALLKNARLDLGRYESAFKEHAIPEQQLATQQALVEQDAGVVQLDEGNLASAQVNMDYTQIISPIDGQVGLRTVDPGNIVAADGTTGLATITQLQPITVIFTISEDDLTEVTEQTSAGRYLRVDALDRAQQKPLAQGTLITLDNQINPTTGTVKARAIFPNKRNELFPNQFVNARLRVKTLSNVVLVPAASIQRNNDAAYVYIVQSGGGHPEERVPAEKTASSTGAPPSDGAKPPESTVQSRDVKIITTEGEVTAVTGVNAGEQLVTDGFDKLQNGSKIIIRDAGAPAAAATPSAKTSPPAHE